MSAFEKRPGLKWILAHSTYEGEGCLIWPFSRCTAGYGQFSNENNLYLSHRYMCTLVHGEPPTDRHETAHSCGNRACVNHRHLSWKTPAGNQLDRRQHGTNTKAGGRWRLTPEQVAEIRQLKRKELPVVVASRFGVTESNIRQIWDGKIWRTGKREPGGFSKVPYRKGRPKSELRL